MESADDTTVERGSGNVFVDLGLPDADPASTRPSSSAVSTTSCAIAA